MIFIIIPGNITGNDIVNVEGLNQAKELRELVLDRNKIKVRLMTICDNRSIINTV